MSIAPLSSVCLPCGKSDFITTDEENFFITASKTSWMTHIHALYGLDPLTVKVGHILVRAFCFEEGVGLVLPDLKQLSTKASILGLDVSNEAKLVHLIKTLPGSKSDIFLSLPLKICNLTPSSFNVITYKKCVIVELTKNLEPEACLSISKSLLPQISCLSNLSKSLSAYRSRFPLGTYQLINEAAVQNVAKLFFQTIPFFEEFIASEHLINVTHSSDTVQFIATKTPEASLDIYALFIKNCWKGSYKLVIQGLKITDQLLPIGASISDISETDSEAKKEIAFRRHPHIGRVLTPLLFNWSAREQDNMIHSWACFGTLHEFLRKNPALGLASLDIISLQMLESLEIFHSHHAVHKDLTSDNFVLDGAEGTLKVFINDVGSSCFSEDEEELHTVATHGYNMAPELLQKCITLKGNFWHSIFKVPVSFEEWVASERFQIACLITKVYLGKTPFEFACKRDEIWDLFPAMRVQFTDYTSQASCYRLDQYLEIEDRALLTRAYDKAFSLYYPTLPGKEGLDPDHLEGEQQFEYLSAFVEIFNSEFRVTLKAFLGKDEAAVKALYKKAEKIMAARFQEAFYGALNLFIASSKTPPQELIPASHAKIKARLDALTPLFNLDPSKRPNLSTIRAALQVAIHLNP